jgi:hypothetical protein
VPGAIVASCCYWVKMKNRSPWFCLFGIVWFVGAIVLAQLPDKSEAQEVAGAAEGPARNPTIREALERKGQ